MRRIFFSALLLTVAASLLALPAKRGIWKTVKLADGKEIKVELRGDEYLSYWQAEDGECFVKDDVQDRFVKADMVKLEQFASEQRLQNPLPYSISKSRVELGGNHPDFVGAKKGLIILAEFSDVKFQPEHDAEYYSHVANDLNFTHPDGFVGSIRDYFRAQSNGKFDLTFDVVGPIQMQYDMEYYGGRLGNYHDKNPSAMVLEAVQGAAKALGSFADYDWFGDGYVDQVFVIYAGRGEADGGGENTIWPHRSNFPYARTYAGKKVLIYACSNEMQAGPDNSVIVDGIGAFCHEFSHCLGLADLYDTVDSKGNYGMNDWDIMHGGCYLGESFRPCNYSAYERNYCGWNEPIVLTHDTEVSNMKSLEEGGNSYVIYNDAYKDEFYVLETRKQSGWDLNLPSSGLLISYIDFDKTIWGANYVNATSNQLFNDHQRFTLFCADNSMAATTVDNDLYPYNRNNLLTNYSFPAATLYHANPDGDFFMSKPITNICKNDDGSISFVFKNEVGKKRESLPEGVYFRERFDYCNGDGGNDELWSPSVTNLSELMCENTNWTIDEGKGGNKCAVLGKSTKAGTAITPVFTINGPAVVNFKGAMYVGNGGNKITLSVNSGDATLSQTSFTLASKKWTDFSATLTAAKYPAEVSLTFKNDRRYCFLDEVYVQTEEMADIEGVVVDVDNEKAVSTRIYTIDGRFAGTEINALSPGLYIRNGKKMVK